MGPHDRVELSIWKGSGWPFGKPKSILIHSTRSGLPNRESLAGHRLELGSTINWFKSLNSRASTNRIVSPEEIVIAVPDDTYGWHAVEHSAFMLSIEVTQAQSHQPYYEEQYHKVAAVCDYWCRKFDIPRIYLPRYSNGMRGISGHEDTEQGLRDGKSDPGNQWDWEKFIDILVRLGRPVEDMPNEYDKLYLTLDPYQIWMIHFVCDIPIYKRWITTSPGAQRLESCLGSPQVADLDQLRTIPSL